MSWAIPKRYLKLTIYQGADKKKVISVLDDRAKISFDTSESVSGAMNECNCSISGLTKEKMLYLSTSTSAWVNERIRNRIVIEAGYDNNRNIVFDGIISDANPDLSNPDFLIQMKAISAYDIMTDMVKSYSFGGAVPASEIARAIAKDAGLGFENGLEEDVIINNYNYTNNSIISHLRYLSSIPKTPLDIWITNNVVKIKNRGKPFKSTTAKIPLISYKTNMIGSPQPNDMGCVVKVRMSSQWRSGQEVSLESIRFKALNSTNYVIQTFHHSGNTRGANWHTNLTLIRKDIYMGGSKSYVQT